MPTPEDGQQRRIGGRYRPGGQLGAGAMGTVWSAFDEVLRRHVAVKELTVILEMVPSRNLATMIVEQGVLTARQAAVVGFTTAAALRAAFAQAAARTCRSMFPPPPTGRTCRVCSGTTGRECAQGT
ncbi:MAG: hypothetical protein ACRDRH_07955 [Pseudonocardia sp.]